MQIPTNTGPITLAPSDIENGMVFRDPTDNDANTFRADPALYTDGIAGMQEVAEALAADVAAGKVYFLGCDPRLTSRAGCERFGVSSTVDAAAHGFARLRDGGAVDLRVRGNVPKGTIISHEYGSRVDFDELLGAKGAAHGANARFVGLNEDHARPEDVRRMCCGATGNGFVFGSPGREVVCTLAIGEHDTHENLATGIKWSAPAKLKLIVGVDLAQRPRSPVTQDGASRSPAGITWPFEFTNGNFTFTAGVASLPVQVSRSEEANDIFLHFVNVPSGDNLFTLRDMFTQMGRVRFTLRDLAGTEARYEATPNDLKTTPNYRLVDATNIEVRVVDVKRVKTADEYWTVPKPSSARDITPNIQRAIVYVAPKRDASSEDMAAVKDAVARLASPEAITCAPLPTQASMDFNYSDGRRCSLMADGSFHCDGCLSNGYYHATDCKVPEWAQKAGRSAVEAYRAGGFEAAREAGMAAIRRLAPATSAYQAGAMSKSEYIRLEDLMASEMRKLVLGRDGLYSLGTKLGVRVEFMWSTCALCDKPIGDARDLVSMSVADQNDPDTKVRFELHVICGEKLQGVRVAAKRGRLRYDQCGMCREPSASSPCAKCSRTAGATKPPNYFNAWDDHSDPPWLLPSAVAFAIANAPSAVNVARWTRVVHVIAADAAEHNRHKRTPGASADVTGTLADVTEAIVAYATLRFVHGYDTKEAARRAHEKGGGFNPKKLDRFFAAYEAGS